MRRLGLRLSPWLLLAACSEYAVMDAGAPPSGPGVEEAVPPGGEDDPFGEPPDEATCVPGLSARYFNLEETHPDVSPEPDASAPPDDPAALDWWDDRRLSFERLDPSVDFGSNWWPVDDGFAADPRYFAVRWTGWLLAREAGTHSFALGAADDAWVLIDGEVARALPGVHPFEPGTFAASLEAGPHTLEILYAHRATEPSGFRFRALSSGVAVCAPVTEGDDDADAAE